MVRVAWSGVWDFYEGPSSLGLVQLGVAYRMEFLLLGSVSAEKSGCLILSLMLVLYPKIRWTRLHRRSAAVRHVARHCQQNSQFFLFETGQKLQSP